MVFPVPGTNPEELIAAAHAACFTMALSFALAREGLSEGTLTTRAAVKLDRDGEGFKVSRSDLTLEARVPGIDADRFAAIAAEAKANCPISKLLNAEIQGLLQTEEARAKLASYGLEVAGSTPEEFRRIVQSELARWTRVIREAGIVVK